MNTRRTFFSSLLAAACMPMLRFFPAPEKHPVNIDRELSITPLLRGLPVQPFNTTRTCNTAGTITITDFWCMNT